MTSLTRFRACSADPNDQSGIATYTRGNLMVNVPIESQTAEPSGSSSAV